MTSEIDEIASLEHFNDAEAEVAGEFLESCAPIPSWRSGLLARRPYESVQEILDIAGFLAQEWSDQEVDLALSHHPRIGEKMQGHSASARASRQEQGDLSQNEDAQQVWFEANEEYEKKFDRIFLIRAAGRSSEEMLDQLRKRLLNSADHEARVRREQLAEIALLRLKQALA